MDKFNYDLSDTENTVMIGNRFWEDILFGNLNNMKTVYVTALNKYTGKKLKESPLF